MDSNSTLKIQETVNALIQQRKPFSAYDITCTIRRLNFNEGHRDVRQVVHDMFNNGAMGSFQQTLVQYPNAPRPAYLYHPPEIDPNDQTTFNAIVAGTLDPNSIPAAPVVQSNDDDDDGTAAIAVGGVPRALTQRNNDGSLTKTLGTMPGSVLYIPRDMAEHIGVPVNGPAYLALDKAASKIVITNILTIDHNKRLACVDRNRNIRITKNVLQEAGIDGNVKVALNGNEILISKA